MPRDWPLLRGLRRRAANASANARRGESMTEPEVIDLIRERMLRAEVPVTHNFQLVLGEGGVWVLSTAGG